ncbi:MAG: hypothetical protein SVX43_02350 [Cyanobacteriota bacterium]|nr:hypothetical protein [Cyanobacteriota bacterium]
MLVLADVIPVEIVIFFGAVLYVGLQLIVIFCETLVLWGLRWGSWMRSFLDAILSNVTSAVFGLVFSYMILRGPGRILENWDWTAVPFRQPVISVLVYWALSVAIEGSVLGLLRQKTLERTFSVAAIANTISYAILMGLFGLWSFSSRL